MTRFGKNLLRCVLLLSYLGIIALVLFGISSLYSYLNTGADRSSILHSEIKKVDQYTPKLEWAPINNEGRPMDTETLNAIEDDYLDAWYVKHLAYKTNTTKGIDDYYTENARKNIFNIVNKNTLDNITTESTTLEHNPTLEFFSEDGQLVVITDRDVIEYKRIYQNKRIVFESTEKSTYKVILLLEDGFWRIRHLIKEVTENVARPIIPASNSISKIKGINYYPQASPWDMFGDKFNPDTISKDFGLIKNAGLNSIRVFVPYEDFGKAHVNQEKLAKLIEVMDMAETEKLKVIVTLFDFYSDYSVLNWTLCQSHASTIVSTLKDHKALMAWDIKNEPNLDFESRGKANVTAWLNHMVDLVKSIDKRTPVTIGWSNAKSTPILNQKLDLITFHYYEKLEDLEQTYQILKSQYPNKPVVITEFGLSSYIGIWNPFGSSENDQADYHKKAQGIFADNNMDFMSWTLYDFTKIPKEVVGQLPWRKQAQGHFGFINKNGDKKPAFSYISKE